MKDILDTIKAECHISSCRECRLCDVCKTPPYSWDTEAIRKALNETVDDPKAEIVVPEKFTDAALHSIADDADNHAREKMNEVIECLEQIKERLYGKNV